MASFLSADWLAELDAAARASSDLRALADDEPFVIEQRVTGTPGGDVQFHLVVDREGARVAVGAAESPALSLITDYATAIAMHRGALNAQESLASGRMKLRGDLGRIVRHADALGRLGDLFASVRADTTMPGGPGGEQMHR